MCVCVCVCVCVCESVCVLDREYVFGRVVCYRNLKNGMILKE